MPAVRILEAAAAEAVGAAAWYESQRAGLGADFREDFRAALDTLEEGVAGDRRTGAAGCPGPALRSSFVKPQFAVSGLTSVHAVRIGHARSRAKITTTNQPLMMSLPLSCG